jgi:hypothetical protein
VLPSGIEISAFDFALKKSFIEESLAALTKAVRQQKLNLQKL